MMYGMMTLSSCRNLITHSTSDAGEVLDAGRTRPMHGKNSTAAYP